MMNVHYAVAVFIVLSGYCLMLPVARAGNGRLPGGVVEFIKRRARRILPAYYAALACVLGIVTISHYLFKHTAGTMVDVSAENVVTHLFLIQNLFQKWSIELDAPMWSVALEWQIYFVFALVLLPMWRRFGIVGTTAAGFALGYLPIVALPRGFNFAWTSPWCLGLFTFGMCAAVVTCSPPGKCRLAKNVAFQNGGLVLIAAGLAMLAVFKPGWLDAPYYWITDVFVGAFTALLILVCGRKMRGPWWQRAMVDGLEFRSATTLGAFSYSLYLIHYPILLKMQYLMHENGFSDTAQMVVLFLGGVPFCLILAYGFHLVWERPFLERRSKKARENTEPGELICPPRLIPIAESNRAKL
jgi:peptidoglycan/LPS O-acetylase OafA/YrhL